MKLLQLTVRYEKNPVDPLPKSLSKRQVLETLRGMGLKPRWSPNLRLEA